MCLLGVYRERDLNPVRVECPLRLGPSIARTGAGEGGQDSHANSHKGVHINSIAGKPLAPGSVRSLGA